MKLLTADNLLSFANLSASAYKIGLALIDWSGEFITRKDLIEKANLKESSFKRAVLQLINYGFIERKEQKRELNGDFGEVVYVCQKLATEPDKTDQVNEKLMVAHLKSTKKITTLPTDESAKKILEIHGLNLETYDFEKAMREKNFTNDEIMVLKEFETYRIRKRGKHYRRLSDETLKNIVDTAARLRAKYKLAEVVKQSIKHGWLGLFPLHKETPEEYKAKLEKQNNAAIEAPTIVTPPDSSKEFAEAMRKQREFYAARGINLEAGK